MITDDIKAEIIRRTDIVDIIGESLDIRRKGRNFISVCPFHNDTHPSLNINIDLQIYKCFSCGAGGDVIKFMMDYHRMSYVEAMKELARKAGVHIPEETYSKSKQEQLSKRELALNALSAVTDFYMKSLATNAGKIAIDFYLKRGFTRELINEFKLGYAPDSWDSALVELKKLGYNNELIFESGLTVKKEDGTFYDRFRNRTIFPIHDILGKVIGFGARQLNEDDKLGKYINSPQSVVYDKSKSLYGLYQAKNEIRIKKYAILVEGYADVLTLHQAGYKSAVASSGTALTKQQLEALSRYTKKIFICYDADEAGIKASERALEIAIETGFDVMIIRLPAGEDPDSIIFKHGKNMFQVYLESAESFLDFKLSVYKNEGLLDNPAGRADCARNLIKLISSIPDRLQHDDYIRRLSTLIQMNESQLLKIYQEKRKYEKKSQEVVSRKKELTITETESGSEKPIAEKNVNSLYLKSGLTVEESQLIKLALMDDEAFNIMHTIYKLTPEKFISDMGKKLFGILVSSTTDAKMMNSILANPDFDEEDKDMLSFIAMKQEEQSSNWVKYSNYHPVFDSHKAIRDNIYRIEILTIEKEKNDIQNFIKSNPISESNLDKLKKIRELDEKIANLKIIYKQD